MGKGNIIGKSNTPTSSVASGIWTLQEQLLYKKQSLWPGVPAGAGDPYFTNVMLLLHGDENFTDSSSNATTITTFNSATISNTVYKFGTGSMNFTTAGSYARFPNSNLTLGTGDWTIELWWYQPASIPAYGVIFDIDATGGTFFIGFSASTTGLRIYSGANGIDYNPTHSMTAGNWYHLAWVRNGSTITIYQNGTSIGSVAAGSATYSPSGSSPNAFINTYGASIPNYQASGHIDEFRITKGVARYTTNFTPPTEAFPNTQATAQGLTTDGLVLNLDAGNASSYSGSGSSWFDLSGNSRTATLINTPTYSSSSGGYLSFNGTNQYATFTAGTPGTTMTVEMWVYFYGTQPNGYGMYFSWNQYDVFDYGTSGMGYNTFGGDVYGVSAATANSGIRNGWKHMIFEMRSDVSYTNNKIYVNKVAQSLSAQIAGETAGNRNFNNGAGQIANAVASYPGKMDLASFRVYNRALTQTEINANYDYQKARYGLT